MGLETTGYSWEQQKSRDDETFDRHLTWVQEFEHSQWLAKKEGYLSNPNLIEWVCVLLCLLLEFNFVWLSYLSH